MATTDSRLFLKKRRLRLASGEMIVIYFDQLTSNWFGVIYSKGIPSGGVTARTKIGEVHSTNKKDIPRFLRLKIAKIKNPKIEEVDRRVRATPGPLNIGDIAKAISGILPGKIDDVMISAAAKLFQPAITKVIDKSLRAVATEIGVEHE